MRQHNFFEVKLQSMLVFELSSLCLFDLYKRKKVQKLFKLLILCLIGPQPQFCD